MFEYIFNRKSFKVSTKHLPQSACWSFDLSNPLLLREFGSLNAIVQTEFIYMRNSATIVSSGIQRQMCSTRIGLQDSITVFIDYVGCSRF